MLVQDLLHDFTVKEEKFVIVANLRYSRLTFTKGVKDVFPLQAEDRIAVYQNTAKINNELIFKVQRRNNIVDT